jgi:hypothetical protein
MKILPLCNGVGFGVSALAVLGCITGICRAQGQSVTNTPVDQTNPNVPADYAVIQRGLDWRIWEGHTYQTNDSGVVFTNTHSYTELATGMAYMRDGQLLDSVEEIDPIVGGFQAVQGRHKVQWTANANTPNGAITLTMSDNSQLVSTVYGLAYWDKSSGSNVLIAPLQDCTGALVASNRLAYPDAFQGVSADLEYVYTRAGLAQDVLVKDLPSPANYGLVPGSTVLQVITAFLSGPEPKKMTFNRNGENFDDYLDFGAMKVGVGKAFLVPGADGSQPAGVVGKHWVQTNQIDYLLEEIPYSAVSNALPAHASNTKPGYGPVWRMASVGRQNQGKSQVAENGKAKLKSAPISRPAARNAGSKAALAANRLANQRYLRLDYEILNGDETPITFQGDTTYYISGYVVLTGTNTFEGGAVIKYTNSSSNPTIYISAGEGAQVNWLAGNYRPVLFTSKDYDYTGDRIAGSTGSPSGYYANPAVYFSGVAPSPSMSHFCIRWAQQAISTDDTDPAFYDGQIVNSSNGVNAVGGTVYLRNLLFANVATAFNTPASVTIDAQNVTFGGNTNYPSGSAVLDSATGNNGNTFNLTNCIFANLSTLFGGDEAAVGASYNGFYNDSAFGSSAVTCNTQPFLVLEQVRLF